MAKRTSTAIVRASTIPTIRLAVPRTAPIVRAPRKRSRRRSRAAVGAAGITPVKAAITAAIVGMAEKGGVFDVLPEVPYVGRKGAVAIIAYVWARHGGGQLARDIALVAATVCGYEFGKEGRITGF